VDRSITVAGRVSTQCVARRGLALGERQDRAVRILFFDVLDQQDRAQGIRVVHSAQATVFLCFLQRPV
jgi:uncharacterized lipoprotein YajG